MNTKRLYTIVVVAVMLPTPALPDTLSLRPVDDVHRYYQPVEAFVDRVERGDGKITVYTSTLNVTGVRLAYQVRCHAVRLSGPSSIEGADGGFFVNGSWFHPPWPQLGPHESGKITVVIDDDGPPPIAVTCWTRHARVKP